MATKDVVVGAALLVLIILTIIFGVRSTTNAAREEAAKTMSGSLIILLRDLSYPLAFKECRSLAAGDYEQLQR